ncbi:SGNH/GDSL hydrolase family protein, partial [Microbacterium terregens]
MAITVPNGQWVVFGDSHTASTGDAATTTLQNRCMDSYHFWASYYLDGGLTQVYNAGINGNTSAQALARIDADVIAKLPNGGLCTVMLGTNDIIQGVTLATFQANMQAIVAALVANRIVPVLLTIPP